MSVMDPPSPAGRRWWSVVRARYREEIGAPSSRGMLHEPAPPSLALAKQRAENRLVLDPATGETFARSRRAAKLADFEALGTGAYTYISLLHRLRAYFALLALLSVSSMVSNACWSLAFVASCARMVLPKRCSNEWLDFCKLAACLLLDLS